MVLIHSATKLSWYNSMKLSINVTHSIGKQGVEVSKGVFVSKIKRLGTNKMLTENIVRVDDLAKAGLNHLKQNYANSGDSINNKYLPGATEPSTVKNRHLADAWRVTKSIAKGDNYISFWNADAKSGIHQSDIIAEVIEKGHKQFSYPMRPMQRWWSEAMQRPVFVSPKTFKDVSGKTRNVRTGKFAKAVKKVKMIKHKAKEPLHGRNLSATREYVETLLRYASKVSYQARLDDFISDPTK